MGRNEPCPCGSGKKFKRCCIDARSAPSVESPGNLTLVVDTSDGMMARIVPPASPLPNRVTQGYAAEAATHDAAAAWGLPDFVFPGASVAKGKGSTRELGDTILVVGEYAVVVQVKSRTAPSSDAEKERRWLAKKAATALSQGAGTIRTFDGRKFELTNARGRRVRVSGAAHRWLVVVVVDHASPPEDVVPAVASAAHPSVVLLRRDWEFLFEQLKSTHAVAGYLARVAGEDLALGEEPARYYELALADAAAPPAPLEPAILGPGRPVSTPLLPLAPAAVEDRAAHSIVRVLLEEIATTRLTSSREEDRLRTLAELDRLPVGQRGEIGRFLLAAMQEVSNAPDDGVIWRLRTLKGGRGAAHLGFGVCSHPHTKEIQEAFGWWAQLRHHELLEARGGDESLTTVAVLLTPRKTGLRRWDTTSVSVSGATEFTDEDLAALREVWPTPKAA